LACSAVNPGCLISTCSAHDRGCCLCETRLCGADLLEIIPRIIWDGHLRADPVSRGCCVHCGGEVRAGQMCADTQSPAQGPPHIFVLVGPHFTLQTHIACWKNSLGLAEEVSRVLASVLACIPPPAAAQARGNVLQAHSCPCFLPRVPRVRMPTLCDGQTHSCSDFNISVLNTPLKCLYTAAYPAQGTTQP